MNEAALAIPAIITNKLKPKPTKSEVIGALALRKLSLIQKEAADAAAIIKAANEAADRAIYDTVVKSFGALKFTTSHGYNDDGKRFGVRITFELDNVPAPVVAALKKVDQARTQRVIVPTLEELKREIREELEALKPNRSETLVNDPGTCAALDALLKQLSE